MPFLPPNQQCQSTEAEQTDTKFLFTLLHTSNDEWTHLHSLVIASIAADN